MMTEKTPTAMTIDGWPFKLRLPQIDTPRDRLLLLLHGHLGNENVMWILTKSIPQSYTLLAPRAPIELGPGQYSWHTIQPQWPTLRGAYQDLASDLLERVDSWTKENAPEIERYDVMGFSQGAVMAYALSFLHPLKINKVAAIAGFVPQTWKNDLADIDLRDRRYFIAHGKQDEIIPIKKARQAEGLLKEKGAEVQFCSADTGHKLGANCFNGLGEFFS
ncbi:MAG: dienelactone hydrolase family protein [Chloroflexota bacterium]|nr:dienelactone hydrolase family protein [Chloroflexota bacterium]